MWINWKMKFEVFIHNDDIMCFHVAIQGMTHSQVPN
jgi:hypothetical protein